MNDARRNGYENKRDLTNEIAAVAAILEHMKCDRFEKLPRFYRIDFLLMKGAAIKYFVEVKCRKNKQAKYPDFMLSMAKYFGMINWQLMSGIPALLVVKWSDGIGTMTLPAGGIKFGWGGRSDRNDDQDMEPVVLIPIDRFHNRVKLEENDGAAEAPGEREADSGTDPEGDPAGA